MRLGDDGVIRFPERWREKDVHPLCRPASCEETVQFGDEFGWCMDKTPRREIRRTTVVLPFPFGEKVKNASGADMHLRYFGVIMHKASLVFAWTYSGQLQSRAVCLCLCKLYFHLDRKTSGKTDFLTAKIQENNAILQIWQSPGVFPPPISRHSRARLTDGAVGGVWLREWRVCQMRP